MGSTKRMLEPYYEVLMERFEEEHGRGPNPKEAGKMWTDAIELMADRADMLRKQEKEDRLIRAMEEDES